MPRNLLLELLFGLVFAALVAWRTFGGERVRVHRRRQRGRCVKCGYVLDGVRDEYCPECGTWAFVTVETFVQRWAGWDRVVNVGMVVMGVGGAAALVWML